MPWSKKFAVAISGVCTSIRYHNSFWVHAIVSLLVLGLAGWLRIESWRWCAMIAAITLVWTTELLNTALEELVKAVHPQPDKGVGHALDVAAGAVLVAAIGAVVIGLLSLGPPLWNWILTVV